MIISHTIIPQVHYSDEATANRAPGQPLVFKTPGRFESAPVVENVEVAAAAGGGGGMMTTMMMTTMTTMMVM